MNVPEIVPLTDVSRLPARMRSRFWMGLSDDGANARIPGLGQSYRLTDA